jgi:hypothetical protein
MINQLEAAFSTSIANERRVSASQSELSLQLKYLAYLDARGSRRADRQGLI